MGKQALFVLLFFIPVPLFSQEKILPAGARPFVLKDYEMLDYITGDINGDKRKDAILILKQKGEDTSYEELQRPFIILTREADGKMRQVKRNDKAIMCRQCGGMFGDPYAGITITAKGFEIYFYGGSNWRWGYTYSFIFKPMKNNWFLSTESQVNFLASDPETTTKTINIYENELGPVSIDNFDSHPKYDDTKWEVTAAKSFFYSNPVLKSKPRKAFLLKGNVATGVRELKNFVQVQFSNDKDQATYGFLLKKHLKKIKP